MNYRNIPVAYAPQKAQKQKIEPKKLYKIDTLGFDTKIGFITNISTTLYEMQAKYDKESAEYEEIDNRLRLCCKLQSAEIDSAKGIKSKGVPKHWTKRQAITDDMTDEEVAKIEFNNRLVIDRVRPYFMRYVYPTKNREYKNFLADFTRLSRIYWGCNIDNISEEEKNTDLYKEFAEYYNRKNPLLETNGIMNKICRYMEQQVKELKISQRYKNDEKMFDLLYDKNTEIANSQELCGKMVEKYENYVNFKKNKMLVDSQYNSYEQYFKAIKNECLAEISSNERELGNLAIYVCYKMFPNKPKDFAWDCFGEYILNYLVGKKENLWLPQKNEYGDIEYLGAKYGYSMLSMKNGEVDLEKTLNIDLEDFNCNLDVDDLELDENIFDLDLEL